MRGCWKQSLKGGLSGTMWRMGSLKADYHYSSVRKVGLRSDSVKDSRRTSLPILFLRISRSWSNKTQSASFPEPHSCHLNGKTKITGGKHCNKIYKWKMQYTAVVTQYLNIQISVCLTALYWKSSVQWSEVKWSEVELRWGSWGQKNHAY
jgi:hypothetical protein